MCKTHSWLIPCLFLLALMSCNESRKNANSDRLLAEVSGRKLYASDLVDVLPQDLEPQDSLIYVQRLVERWAQNQVMLIEAEKILPENVNIEKLLKNYRESLLLNHFETNLVDTYLDNRVKAIEIQTYYDAHKELFELESPILRCHFIKLKRPNKNVEKIRKWWNSSKDEDFQRMKSYSLKNAETAILDDQVWHSSSEILDELPPELINPKSLKSNKKFSLTSDTYYYFLKVFETVLKKEIAPLSFVEDKARKVILHGRKNQLLDRLKKDFYKKALEENRVNIYL